MMMILPVSECFVPENCISWTEGYCNYLHQEDYVLASEIWPRRKSLNFGADPLKGANQRIFIMFIIIVQWVRVVFNRLVLVECRTDCNSSFTMFSSSAMFILHTLCEYHTVLLSVFFSKY